MRLTPESWVLSGGLSAEWAGVMRRREAETLARLGKAAARAGREAPAGLRRTALAGLRWFLARGGPERARLATHPALDYWLFLWDKHFSYPCRPEDWALQLGLFQGFPAALALLRGETLELDAALDPDARFQFFGTPWSVSFPAGLAHAPVRLSVRKDRVSFTGPQGLAFSAAREELPAAPGLAPGVFLEDKSWLILHGVVMHGRTELSPETREAFTSVLRRAFADMAERAPGLHAEMTDLVRLIVPLKTPETFASVSSSYVNMRGAICLSHSDDPLLQAETLIHEFCHQKMNQLMVADPILVAGQGGQVFYSPWRKDARRLRGLLLGAHAFLNVARYLIDALAADTFRKESDIGTMVNAAQRVFQVESALRTLSFYGTFTPFGREFMEVMWRELGLMTHALLPLPPALVAEAKELAAKHRAEHALYETGFHRVAGFADRLGRAPFLTPGEPPAPAPAAAKEAAA